MPFGFLKREYEVLQYYITRKKWAIFEKHIFSHVQKPAFMMIAQCCVA